jgi:hypothetical protein
MTSSLVALFANWAATRDASPPKRIHWGRFAEMICSRVQRAKKDFRSYRQILALECPGNAQFARTVSRHLYSNVGRRFEQRSEFAQSITPFSLNEGP